MSVVAWDGTRLAADKRAIGTNGIIRTTTKIERLANGDLIGMAGDWDICCMVREWYRAGADPETFPKRAEEGEAIMVVISAVDGAILSYCSGPYSMKIEGGHYAIGSGRDFAEAAMHLGHDAVDAVDVAIALSNGCGNGIDALLLHPRKKVTHTGPDVAAGGMHLRFEDDTTLTVNNMLRVRPGDVFDLEKGCTVERPGALALDTAAFNAQYEG